MGEAAQTIQRGGGAANHVLKHLHCGLLRKVLTEAKVREV